MKKIIALALALVMIVALAIPAFAVVVESVEQVTGSTQSTKVKYGVSQTYTVVLPSMVDFQNDTTANAEAVAKNVVIGGDKELTIKVASANAWTMTCTGCTPVPYTLTADAVEIEQNGTVLSLAASSGVTNDGSAAATAATKTVALVFTTPGTTQAGNYEDTLTFTVAVD